MPMMASLNVNFSSQYAISCTHKMKKIADSRLGSASEHEGKKFTYSILKTTTSSVPTILKPSKTVIYRLGAFRLQLQTMTYQFDPDKGCGTTQHLEALESKILRSVVVTGPRGDAHHAENERREQQAVDEKVCYSPEALDD
jgi:hypothetical protein